MLFRSIINDATGSSYCGYDNYVAEVSVVSADETVFKPNFCKKCLKGYEKTNKSVGIDTGIKDLAILSDGSSYENIKSLKTKLKK